MISRALEFILAALFFAIAMPAQAVIHADSADDVCAPAADPCVITEPVRFDARTTVDFGLRTVEMSGEGRLDTGPHSVTVKCGDFEASIEGTAIDARGPTEGGFRGGHVQIEARRACEIADPEQPCLEDGNCYLGLCSARVCSGSQRQTCSTDANCQLGPCLPFGSVRRCQGNLSTFCSTNADCDLGTCPAELYCSRLSEGKRQCTSDADCELGSCSVGSGSISLDGSVDGRADRPADLTLSAADSITVSGPVNLSSRSKQGDGGHFSARATYGNLAILGKVRARGGITGGWHVFEAGGDLLLAGRIDIDGGDFDGGILDITSGGKVTIRESIRANARNGQGYGGEVTVFARGDIEIGPGPDTRRLQLSTNGHGDRFGEAGDGGYQDYASEEGSVIVHEGVRIVSNAGSPGGIGGETHFDAREHAQFDGEIYSRGRGSRSQGGGVYFWSYGTVELGATSIVDVDGSGGGGDLFIRGEDEVVVAGFVTASGPADTEPGEIEFEVGDLQISGQLFVGGNDSSQQALIYVDACRIALLPGAALVNTAAGGLNRLLARESMRLMAGSELLAEDGFNRLGYRTDDKPPVIDGLVDTPAVLDLLDDLAGCPVCGNGEIDQFETCDDGNAVGGDGCSSLCRIE